MTRQIVNLTPDRDAATRLHWIEEDGALWLDTDVSTEDGLVIGVGATLLEAVDDAIVELRQRLADLESARAERHRSAQPCGCDPGAQYVCEEHAAGVRS